MKTYQADGYSFTEAELKGDNPYKNPDGSTMDGCAFKFWAFAAAKSQYQLDQMSEDERREAISARERFQRRMDAEAGAATL